MLNTFHKFKSSETKSIASAVLHLPTSEIIINEPVGTGSIILHDTDDNLLVEALNQITTVEANLNTDTRTISTNFSRYVWKLNPALKENKMRLQLLRILKPIGLFFLVRNTNSDIFLTLTDIEYNTFKIKWESIYGPKTIFGGLPYEVWEHTNNNIIFINWAFRNIIGYAVSHFIIDDLEQHKINKENILISTLEKIDFLTNE